MKRSLLLFVVLVGITACDYIPISSGALQGTVAEVPTDWISVASSDIIQLETNPADPYSVNLWIVEMDGDLFVHAGDNRAQWIENIEANPAVRLGVDGKIYNLTASRITDQGTFDRFAEVWKAKYGSHPGNMDVAEAYLMRLR